MVRITEFESARVSPLTPEISASTSSAISALLIYITSAYDVCKVFFSSSEEKFQFTSVCIIFIILTYFASFFEGFRFSCVQNIWRYVWRKTITRDSCRPVFRL